MIGATRDVCIECSAGKWSNQTGAFEENTCAKCDPGTWSETRGASGQGACKQCRIGRYQDIFGAANSTLCIQCAPGQYSDMTGVSICEACPPGKWGDSFAMTTCSQCPVGKWSRRPGAYMESSCAYCGSQCSGGSIIIITLDIAQVSYVAISISDKDLLIRDVAKAMTEALNGTNVSVEDLQRISGGIRVISAVTLPDGMWVQSVVSGLETQSFLDKVANTTYQILSGGVIARVTAEPAAYTTTTSSTSVVIEASSSTTTKLHAAATDVTTTFRSSTTSAIVSTTSQDVSHLSAAVTQSALSLIMFSLVPLLVSSF